MSVGGISSCLFFSLVVLSDSLPVETQGGSSWPLLQAKVRKLLEGWTSKSIQGEGAGGQHREREGGEDLDEAKEQKRQQCNDQRSKQEKAVWKTNGPGVWNTQSFHCGEAHIIAWGVNGKGLTRGSSVFWPCSEKHTRVVFIQEHQPTAAAPGAITDSNTLTAGSNSKLHN